MADSSVSVDQLSVDEFICPVCLDLLKDPVAIPCGHSFCNVCINDCWDQEDKSGVYSCPQCRDTFTPRPVLCRNNKLAEVVEKLKEKKEKKKKKKKKKRKKKTEVQAGSPAHCYAGPGDVECDFCTGRKHKAIKSCLMCLASFCETHLKPHYEVPGLKKHSLVEASGNLEEKICSEPHYEVPGLKKHSLVEASGNLEEKICSEHDKVLEIYCRTDRRFICYLCVTDEHKSHDTVSVKAYRTEKQSELKEEQMKSQQRIQEKQKKVQELKQAVNTIKLKAQTAVEDSERIFTEMISSMEKRRLEVTELIRTIEKARLSQPEQLLEQLEQEIADLQKRLAELEKLTHTHDHIQFLKQIKDLVPGHHTPQSASPNVQSDHCKGFDLDTFFERFLFDVKRKPLANLKVRLEELCQETFIKISQNVEKWSIFPEDPQSRDQFLKYFCHLTLDPNTAHYNLILSEKNKVVTLSETQQPYSNHPERFDYYEQVLSKENVCGRCYWEVEICGTGDVHISVSYKDIIRKGKGADRAFGGNKQSWTLRYLSSSRSFYHNNNRLDLRAPVSSRIGVYVDHSAGTLSFYSVSDTMELLHRAYAVFTQPLYVGFRLYWNIYSGIDPAMILCDPKK